MRRRWSCRVTAMTVRLLFAAIVAWPAVAAALTEGDFEVKTARNLLDLCTVTPEDPRY